MFSIQRFFRHLLMSRSQVKRAFPEAALTSIEREIKASEATHLGEVRFVVEGALSDVFLFQEQSVRERAIDVFSELRMWDTEDRNGVLIYLLLADKCVEIVADRGIHNKTGNADWETICSQMEAMFREQRYEAGALDGIRAVTRLLQNHFPSYAEKRNELPDTVLTL